jgi:hypothetical protein
MRRLRCSLAMCTCRSLHHVFYGSRLHGYPANLEPVELQNKRGCLRQRWWYTSRPCFVDGIHNCWSSLPESISSSDVLPRSAKRAGTITVGTGCGNMCSRVYPHQLAQNRSGSRNCWSDTVFIPMLPPMRRSYAGQTRRPLPLAKDMPAVIMGF